MVFLLLRQQAQQAQSKTRGHVLPLLASGQIPFQAGSDHVLPEEVQVGTTCMVTVRMWYYRTCFSESHHAHYKPTQLLTFVLMWTPRELSDPKGGWHLSSPNPVILEVTGKMREKIEWGGMALENIQVAWGKLWWHGIFLVPGQSDINTGIVQEYDF